jgi:hypothetical protein
MQFRQLKRREFITLLGTGALAWPLAARAQQTAMPIVGFVTGRSPEESARLGAAFRKGLNETALHRGFLVLTPSGHRQFENGAAQTDHFVAFRGLQIPVLIGLSWEPELAIP